MITDLVKLVINSYLVSIIQRATIMVDSKLKIVLDIIVNLA
jgi:hypothetical protein